MGGELGSRLHTPFLATHSVLRLQGILTDRFELLNPFFRPVAITTHLTIIPTFAELDLA